MDEISNEFKDKALRWTLTTVVILIAIVIAISCYRKQSKTVIENGTFHPSYTQEKIIFDDIKIQINNDMFSFDQIRNEVKEKDIISYFKKNIRKGDTVLYVSQDVGVQQLLIAKLISQSGRIYVLNPFEKYNDTLKISAKSNGFGSRVFAETVAISDTSSDGLLVYKISESPEYGTIKSSNYELEKGFNALKVKVTTLDNLHPNLQNIDFLRISRKKDAIKAIKGAQQIIRHSPNIKIILDYDQEEFQNSAADINQLQNDGFKTYQINTDGEIAPLNPDETTRHIVLQKN